MGSKRVWRELSWNWLFLVHLTGIITLRSCRFLPMPYSYNTELLCIWDIKVGFWMAVGVA